MDHLSQCSVDFKLVIILLASNNEQNEETLLAAAIYLATAQRFL
jgi:hypothetical protein